MMLCRYCGMETRNTQICEWCHRQLTTGAPVAAQPLNAMDLTQPMPPGMEPTQAVPQHQFRTALTGEVIAVDPQAQAVAPPMQSGYGQAVTHGHAPLPAQGRPPSVMPSHLAGLPHQAVGPELMKQATAPYRSSPGERWEKALAISMPILLISVWIVHSVPSSLPWVVLVDLFAVAMALGGTAAIGSYDDAYLDVGVVLLVAFFFGPAAALVVYVIVGALKQEMNGAIVALLLSHLLVRFIVLLGFPMNAGAFTVLPGLLMFSLIGMLSICATFAGWMLSSFFRPLNE